MSSLSSETESDDDFGFTPKKRRYRRSLFYGKRKNALLTGLHTTGEMEGEDHTDMDTIYDLDSPTDGLSSSSQCSLSEGTSECSLDDTLSEIENQFADSSNEDDALQEDDVQLTDKSLYNGSSHTLVTSYVSIMLFVMKHSLTKSAFSDLLMLISSHMPKPCTFTTSVYKLKEFLKSQIHFKEPLKHYLCTVCGGSLDEGKLCNKTGCKSSKSKAYEFHDLRLETQIAELFKDPVFCKTVLGKQTYGDESSNKFTDISDGSEYHRLAKIPKIATSERKLTLTMNTDGVALFSSSHKGSLWPVYLAINELPVKLRFSKKYLITSHLYCQPEKPNMLMYLSPLVNILKKLHFEAKAAVLNMKQYNGKFGCSYCLDEGAHPPGRPLLRYYPFSKDSVARTHLSMVCDAETATIKRNIVHGIKGANPLILLKYVDLPKTFVIDWMHSVLLGVVKTMLTLWCDPSYRGRMFYIGDKECVSEEDVDTAEGCLKDFCQLFPTYYDRGKQTMNVHLLQHLANFVRLHGPLFHYSCFGFESMNNHLKKMVHGTRYINNQICFAVEMAKYLPELVKSLLEKADPSVKILMQRLSNSIISEESGDATVKGLGAKKKHDLTDTEKALLQTPKEQAFKYYRVQTSIGVIFSEDYNRTLNKNSYTVKFVDNMETEKYGSVRYFIEISGKLFAVVKKFKLEKKTLFDFKCVKHELMKKYKTIHLCPQIVQLKEDLGETVLVPVEDIKTKCVYIVCKRNLKFLSSPPNLLEHD